MMLRGRRGNTLVVVLAITLLLASQIYIINVLSSGNFRQVEKVNAHVRAIYVGESALSKMIARLKGESWGNRWFVAAPFEENGVPLAGGKVDTFAATIATTDGSKAAHLWVRAQYEGSVVAMYSRAQYVDDTLDFHAQVYPDFFSFLPPEKGAPRAGSQTERIIQDMLDEQAANEPKARDKLDKVRGRPDLAGVGAELGLPGAGAGVDVSMPPGGGAGQPQAPRVQAYQDLLGGLTGLLPIPPIEIGVGGLAVRLGPRTGPASASAGPTTPGVPYAMSRAYNPVSVMQAIETILRVSRVELPSGDPAATAAFYKDPSAAREKWNEGADPKLDKNSKIDERWAILANVIQQLGEKDNCPSCRTALDQIMEFCRLEAMELADNKNANPPTGSDASPGPSYSGSAYKNVFEKYGDFFQGEFEKK